MIAICDMGPLLGYLNRNDPHRKWAVAFRKQVRAPMLVCEPVLTEVVYFLREDGLAVDPLFQLLEREALRLDFDISSHWPRIRTRMARYRQMDLAGASIARTSASIDGTGRQVINFVSLGKGAES